MRKQTRRSRIPSCHVTFRGIVCDIIMDILQSKPEAAEVAETLRAEKSGEAQSIKLPRLDSVDLLRGGDQRFT